MIAVVAVAFGFPSSTVDSPENVADPPGGIEALTSCGPGGGDTKPPVSLSPVPNQLSGAYTWYPTPKSLMASERPFSIVMLTVISTFVPTTWTFDTAIVAVTFPVHGGGVVVVTDWLILANKRLTTGRVGRTRSIEHTSRVLTRIGRGCHRRCRGGCGSQNRGGWGAGRRDHRKGLVGAMSRRAGAAAGAEDGNQQ